MFAKILTSLIFIALFFTACGTPTDTEQKTSHNIVKKQFRVHPIVAILGPRQCGKTTLARMFIKEKVQSVTYFDLEDPGDLIQFDTPKLTLSPLKGLVVIDEIQRKEDLFLFLDVKLEGIQNLSKIPE